MSSGELLQGAGLQPRGHEKPPSATLALRRCTQARNLRPLRFPPAPAAGAPLEGYSPSTWVAFDRVLVVKDIYTGGVRTFLSREDAHLYRKMLYAQVGPQRARQHGTIPLPPDVRHRRRLRLPACSFTSAPLRVLLR